GRPVHLRAPAGRSAGDDEPDAPAPGDRLRAQLEQRGVRPLHREPGVRAPARVLSPDGRGGNPLHLLRSPRLLPPPSPPPPPAPPRRRAPFAWLTRCRSFARP